MGDGPGDSEEIRSLSVGMAAVMFLIMVAVIGGLMWISGTWGGPR